MAWAGRTGRIRAASRAARRRRTGDEDAARIVAATARACAGASAVSRAPPRTIMTGDEASGRIRYVGEDDGSAPRGPRYP